MNPPLIVQMPRGMVLSANDRKHWRAAAKITADLRALARAMAVANRMEPVAGPVDATVTVSWPDRRRRDVPNLAPTYKALLDGMVDAGVLADDNDSHVRRTTFQAADDRCPTGHVRVRIEFTPTEEDR